MISLIIWSKIGAISFFRKIDKSAKYVTAVSLSSYLFSPSVLKHYNPNWVKASIAFSGNLSFPQAAAKRPAHISACPLTVIGALIYPVMIPLQSSHNSSIYGMIFFSAFIIVFDRAYMAQNLTSSENYVYLTYYIITLTISSRYSLRSHTKFWTSSFNAQSAFWIVMSYFDWSRSLSTFIKHGIIYTCLLKKSLPTFSANLPTASPAASRTT